MKYSILFSRLIVVLLLINISKVTAQVTKLKDIIGEGKNGRYERDVFGSKIAISDNIIVVGVSGHNYDENDTNYSSRAGAAFIFYRDEGGKNNWGLKKKLVSTGAKARKWLEYFGSSVAISKNMIMVGAIGHSFDRNDSDSLRDAGAVFIFYRNEGGADNWGLKTKIIAQGQNERIERGRFGNSIALEGNIAVINSRYIFYKDEGGIDNWGFKKLLIPSGKDITRLGSASSISNNIIVAGNEGYSYDENGNNYVDFSGGAFIFYKDEGGIDNWGQVKIIVPQGQNSRHSSDNFGISVSIKDNTIFVGSSNQDYDENGLNFRSNAGAVYVYYKDEGGADNWGQIKKIVASSTIGRVFGDQFGATIAASDETLVVGVKNHKYDADGKNELDRAGGVYIYKKNKGGADNWGLETKIVGSGTNGRKSIDWFGYDVAFSNKTLVIGSPNQSYYGDGTDSVYAAGKATIYQLGFPLGINKIQENNNIIVASEGKNIHLSFTDNDDYKISVYDLMGRKITQTQTKKSSKKVISLPQVSTGYYLVKVLNGNTQQEFKTYLQ